MIDWRIYYDDVTFDSSQGTVKQSPSRGVQAIVIKDTDPTAANVGRFVLSRKDYYWHENGEWSGGDIFGLYDFLMRSGLVKFGRTISRQEHRKVLQRAIDDPGLPPKSGFQPDEIKP